MANRTMHGVLHLGRVAAIEKLADPEALAEFDLELWPGDAAGP